MYFIHTDIKSNNNIILQKNITYHLTTKLTSLLNSHTYKSMLYILAKFIIQLIDGLDIKLVVDKDK